MADNVNIKDAAGATVTVATDEITDGTLGTVQTQYTKLMDGTLGSSNKAIVNASGELLVVLNDTTGNGSLSAVGNAVTMILNGDDTVFVQCSGTHAGTQVFEGTVDGTNWFAINGVVPSTGALATSFTANGQWACDVAGLAQFRVRRSVSTSGAAVVYCRASPATSVIGFDQSLPTGSNVIGAVTQSGGWTASVQGTQALGSTTATNPVKAAGIVATGNPTAQANNALIHLMTDKVGRLAVVQGHVREMVGKQATTITSSTTATTVVTAPGASVFADITSLIITNGSGTATNVTLSDGTTSFVFNLPAGGGFVSNYSPPLPATTANTAWTLTCSVSVASVYCNVVFTRNL